MLRFVPIIFGILGTLLILLGFGWAILWKVVQFGFERFLKAQYANEAKIQVFEALSKIRNPLIRNVLTKHAGTAAGTFIVSAVRSELTARYRMGLLIIALGICVLISGFYAPSWWPWAEGALG